MCMSVKGRMFFSRQRQLRDVRFSNKQRQLRDVRLTNKSLRFRQLYIRPLTNIAMWLYF